MGLGFLGFLGVLASFSNTGAAEGIEDPLMENDIDKKQVGKEKRAIEIEEATVMTIEHFVKGDIDAEKKEERTSKRKAETDVENEKRQFGCFCECI